MNYFNYFSEVEERFQQRRGSILMLSTLDWAVVESWREAGIPLVAVLKGIDEAFDRYEVRARKAKGRLRKVNGLAWAAQSVMAAAEAAAAAQVGVSVAGRESGFEGERVAEYLEEIAVRLETLRDGETAVRLRQLAGEARGGMGMEELDRVLTALEERMLAGVMARASEGELVELREQAARELAPYRGKMGAVQIRQVQQQFLQKRLLEARGLPRLSLFYMRQE